MTHVSNDIEMANRKEYPNGFASVAACIAADPDNTTIIYRRFDRLTARNLLYMQSRLQKLEVMQDQLDDEDLKARDDDTKDAATSWETFDHLAEDLGERETERGKKARKRRDIVEEIQRSLKTYHEALLLYSEALRLEAPAKHSLRAFKKWFEPIPGRARLRGNSGRILDDENDLLALKAPADQDRLTRIVQRYCPGLFVADVGVQGDPTNDAFINISERKIARFVAYISSLLAAILLIGAIVILHYVESPDWRIALIAVLTILFAGSVGLLTTANRAEVFTATAAYAAVLVVFVSGNAASSPHKD